MKKILKIAGIIVLSAGAFFVLFIIVVAYRSTLYSSSLSEGNFQSGGSGLPSRSLGFTLPGSGALMSGSMEDSPKASSVVESSVTRSDSAQVLAETDKKIIKIGSMNLKVESTDEALEKVSVIAEANGGEIFSSDFSQYKNNVKSGNITVKVPADNFEKTFAEIKKVASLVVHESISGQDVTEQYIDLKAQLSNRQAEEQSFLKIFERAQKIEDVLAVTAQLARVRGNIEQLQGKIKFLESQTDMSTISIHVSEDENITIVDSWRPWQIVKESVNSLLKSLQGLLAFVIRLLLMVIPFLLVLLLVLGVIVWVLYRIGKKVYFKIKNINN